MRLSARQYIFYLTIIFACGYANAGAIAKRASGDNDSGSGLRNIANTVDSVLKNIPIVGNLLSRLFNWAISVVSLVEGATNGGLGRLLGGALPCEVSLDGLSCTGLTNNGGFGKSVMDVISDIPGYLLPGPLKTVVSIAIKLFIDPTVDVIFGGVATDS